MQLVTDARRRLLERLLALSRAQRRAAIEAMPDGARRALYYDWYFWRRETQAPPPGRWRYWLALAGRGWGKTRVAAEYVREQVREGRARRIGLIGRTLREVEQVMITGTDGILALSPPHERPTYIEGKRLLVWPNRAIGYIYTSEEPDLLRGPGLDLVWGDELASWKKIDSMILNMDLVLRRTGPKGDPARAVLTTTPRPLKAIRELLKDPRCAVTRGSTYENRANLDPTFLAKLEATYEGTRIGRQELYAEVLDDAEGALWTPAMIERSRVVDYPQLMQLVVAVDPAVTSKKTSAETGMIVIGGGIDGDLYVLEDLSCRLSPHGWGSRAVDAYDRWQADAIVVEVNNGGDLLRNTIHAIDPRVVVTDVRATRGKRTRAEPVSALYERDPSRVHHVGQFPALEEQMLNWTGDNDEEKSPDRVDALVWGATKIALEHVESLNVGFA